MASLRPILPVKLFVGILHVPAVGLDAVREILEAEFGPADLLAGPWPHAFTEYYKDEMGPALLRSFVAFEPLIDPARLASIKLLTNALEGRFGPPGARPVNLDPGYVTAAKVVLATVKDYSHRMYIGDGIYAEVTLHYEAGRWNDWPWTYPDYRTEPYKRFFTDVREKMKADRRRLRH